MIRNRWEWPDAKIIIKHTAKAERIPIGIEEAGQQKGFIDELHRDPELMRFGIKGYRPDTDKLTRALPWISRAAAGKIHLVQGPWINEFLSECQVFTGHGDKHDDQIDAVSGVWRMTTAKKRAGRIF